MDLRDLRNAIRQSWWLIALVTVLCTGAAAAYSARTPATYASHTQLFVAAQAPRRTDLQATYQGGLFTTQRVQSYARIASSPLVTAPVVRRLKLDDTPTGLSKRIAASAPPDTVLVDITVTDTSADRAQRVASAVAWQFAKTVEQLERPTRSSDPPVRLSPSLPATHPSRPIAPRTKLNIAGGAVLGLLLSLLAAFVRWRLDTSITVPSELPSGPGAALLGAVPFDRDAEDMPAVGLRKATLARAEALRQLRTNLRFVDPDRPPATILVTSASAGEGKTTTAVGLAMAMADAGVSVILVEGDLRQPSLTEHLGLMRTQGVCGYLVESKPVDDLLVGWPAGMQGGSLRILPAGPVPPNPSELLGSQRMKDLLAELRSRCDIVLIDAPPVLPVADATVLAPEADGVLMVARMGGVTKPQLTRALQALERVHARVLGFVANAVPESSRDYGPGSWGPLPAPPPELPPVSTNGTASTAGRAR
ncbi:MAG TPA: polysaccharide biosynthesis tyrosine autokinase [Baekduia sp.]|nr:polysaccharide biosynthesis tyrosine autokinase [Baekduia sp.]